MKKKKKIINAMNICEWTPTQRNLVIFEGMMNMLVTGNARYVTLTDLGMAIMNTRYVTLLSWAWQLSQDPPVLARVAFILYITTVQRFFLTSKTRSRNHCYWSV